MQTKAVKDGNSNFDVRHMREIECFFEQTRIQREVILPLCEVLSDLLRFKVEEI